MKKNLLLLLFLCCSAIFTSCVNNDNFDETKAIIGNWEGIGKNTMGCEFVEDISYGQGYVMTSKDGGNIDDIILNYCSSTWEFNEDTHIDYIVNTQNSSIKFLLYNVDPKTKITYNQDVVTVKYYIEDYNHLVIDGAEFERQ